jgi:hypothetical protein
MDITEEEIARKMNIPWEQFQAYLNASGKTPNEVLTQLWMSYDDLIKALQRSALSVPLKHNIALVKRLGKAKGMEITDEEIIRKISLSQTQFEAYLNGEVPTPATVLSLFRSAWPDLFKNVVEVSITVTEEIQSDDEDD